MEEMIGEAIAIIVACVIARLLLKGIDRKLATFMQSRIGPPIAQPLNYIMIF